MASNDREFPTLILPPRRFPKGGYYTRMVERFQRERLAEGETEPERFTPENNTNAADTTLRPDDRPR
ncbi:MAG: hypothetical protein SF029_17085 [bacterium]|nr:hypothetical protein [bacterium]